MELLCLDGHVDTHHAGHPVSVPLTNAAVRVSLGDKAIGVPGVSGRLTPTEARDVLEDLWVAGGKGVRAPDHVRRAGHQVGNQRQRRKGRIGWWLWRGLACRNFREGRFGLVLGQGPVKRPSWSGLGPWEQKNRRDGRNGDDTPD